MSDPAEVFRAAVERHLPEFEVAYRAVILDLANGPEEEEERLYWDDLTRPEVIIAGVTAPLFPVCSRSVEAFALDRSLIEGYLTEHDED